MTTPPPRSYLFTPGERPESPVDGVTRAIDDVDRVRNDASRAKRLGFGGKRCIHPRQVPIVIECFSPSPSEIAWARHVMEASAGGAAVLSLGGELVERPVTARAQAILALAEAG